MFSWFDYEDNIPPGMGVSDPQRVSFPEQLLYGTNSREDVSLTTWSLRLENCHLS